MIFPADSRLHFFGGAGGGGECLYVSGDGWAGLACFAHGSDPCIWGRHFFIFTVVCERKYLSVWKRGPLPVKEISQQV